MYHLFAARDHNRSLQRGSVKNSKIIAALLLSLTLAACSKTSTPPSEPTSQQKAATTAPATPTPPPAPETPAPAATPAATGQGVKTEMRNVMFHLTSRAAAHIETLSGELWPTGKFDMPDFDDKTSFEVRVTSGRISLTPAALTEIMNSHVFAAKDAPLKDLNVSIKDGQLIIKGKLHSKGDISFETSGTLTVNSDGRLRVKTERVKALHVPLKGVMSALRIELADVINTSKIDGVDTDKNDLLMDLSTLLPPPHIRGKVSAVRVADNTITTIFGTGEKVSALDQKESTNYMYFQGNRVRFGKLTMQDTDLMILDLDPADPLDWNQDRYADQLAAGYSKMTEKFALRTYVKDYNKVPRFAAARAAIVPKPTDPK
jgi:hypothetical protein